MRLFLTTTDSRVDVTGMSTALRTALAFDLNFIFTIGPCLLPCLLPFFLVCVCEQFRFCYIVTTAALNDAGPGQVRQSWQARWYVLVLSGMVTCVGTFVYVYCWQHGSVVLSGDAVSEALTVHRDFGFLCVAIGPDVLAHVAF